MNRICEIENVNGAEVFFAFPIELSDDQVWEWADQQEIGTIHHISFRHGSVCITPLWIEDCTLERTIEWEKDCTNYFDDLINQ